MKPVPSDCIDYVRAALALQGYGDLDEARIAETARQFSRIAAIAAPMLSGPLADDSEPAPIFRP